MSTLLPLEAGSPRTLRGARLSVVCSIVFVVALACYLGWKEGYFTPADKFYFQAGSSKSLRKGVAVRLSGFKIGQVSGVALQSDRSVRVDFVVFRHYQDFVKSDSEVRLESDLPLAEASLEIYGGSGAAPRAQPGSALHFRDQPQTYDRVLAVVEHVQPMIENLTALLTQMRQPQSELQVTARNLADVSTRVSAWLPGFLERTDTTLTSLNGATAKATRTFTALSAADGDFQNMLRDLRVSAAEMRTTVPPLLADLKALTASLRTSANALEPSIERLAPQLPKLVEQAQQTATQAGQVIDAVKDVGFIGRRVNQPPPEALLPTTPP